MKEFSQPTFEEEHHPEIVEGGKAIRRLERLNVKEDLTSPEKRVDFFKRLTDAQYKKMLGYINSLTRGERVRYDYADGQLPMQETPALDQKEPLMNETFASIREILGRKEVPPRDMLRLAALTLAGAINVTHPYENGNGRTGRVMHYLMEFGTERGDALFEDELYALIAKLPLLKEDSAKVIDDTPPPELDHALGAYTKTHDATYGSLDLRAKAAEKVRTFLSMMKGEITVPILDEVIIFRRLKTSDPWEKLRYEPGEIDGRELYLQFYLAESTAPNRTADEIPKNAILNKGRREGPSEMIGLNIDLV